jgi:hypothetical protein
VLTSYLLGASTSPSQKKKSNLTLYVVIAITVLMIVGLIFVMVTVIILKGQDICTGGVGKEDNYALMM